MIIKTRREKRVFFASFCSTLCVLLLFIGMMEVDANSRYIGFGDSRTLFYEITGQTWRETCNTVEIWYNQTISSIKRNDAEES